MSSLLAPARKYFICMMMSFVSVVMVMASAGAVLIMFMMMLMVVIMMVFMVMIVASAGAVLIMFVMMLMLFVIVMMLVIMTAATFVIMMIMMFVVVMLVCMFFQDTFDLSAMLQGMQNGIFSKFFPRCGNNGCLCIFLTQHMHALFYLFICHHLGTADNDRRCMLYLVIEEFSEVLEIDLCFLTVNNCDSSVNLNICLIFDTLDCFYNIRKLSNS